MSTAPYTRPTQQDYEQKLCAFRDAFLLLPLKERKSIDVEDIVDEIRKFSDVYVQKIHMGMFYSKTYGAVCRDDAFSCILDDILKTHVVAPTDDTRDFYLRQLALFQRAIAEDNTTFIQYDAHNAFRDAFETYANMKDAEGYELKQNKKNRTYAYIPAHSEKMIETVHYLESIPYIRRKIDHTPSWER